MKTVNIKIYFKTVYAEYWCGWYRLIVVVRPFIYSLVQKRIENNIVKMVVDIKKVLICDAVDAACVALLEANGIQVSKFG